MGHDSTGVAIYSNTLLLLVELRVSNKRTQLRKSSKKCQNWTFRKKILHWVNCTSPAHYGPTLGMELTTLPELSRLTTALDSIHRPKSWQLMWHYGIQDKVVHLIKHSYEGITCKVVHGRDVTQSFSVHTGVRQGCPLSWFVFVLALAWVMINTANKTKTEIQWTL